MKILKGTIFVFFAGAMLFAMGSFYTQKIVLKGKKTFAEIIKEAEKQLKISIELPIAPNNKDVRNYDHKITLDTLLVSVKSFYKARGMDVAWRKRGNLIEVYEKKKPRSVPVIKNEPKKLEHIESPYKKVQRPVETRRIISIPQRNSIQSQPSTTQDLLNKLSRNVIDTGRHMDLMDLSSTPETRVTRPTASKGVPQMLNEMSFRSKENPNLESSIEISPYPEGALAFINDAPPLVPTKGEETFVEWENRMKGAVQQGNRKLLQHELEELEARLRWIKRVLNKR